MGLSSIVDIGMQRPCSEAPAATGQRRRKDRRRRATPFLSRYWLVGRRRRGRRENEHCDIYVDRYSRGEWLLAGGILLLSVLDMIFTLVHLDAGGTEANPVMAFTLAQGGYALFKVVKLATTVLGLTVLLIHVRFRRVKGLLIFAFTLYAGIFLFHLYLVGLRSGLFAG